MTTSTSSVGELADGRFDLVGDVRNNLDRLAEVVALAFLVDHRLVDLAGRVIAVARQRGIGKAFVMAQVEIGLGAIVEDVDFAVLIGAHRAGIDIDVGIELLQADAQPALFEQHADRGAGQALAQRTHDAAGDKNVLTSHIVGPLPLAPGKWQKPTEISVGLPYSFFLL